VPALGVTLGILCDLVVGLARIAVAQSQLMTRPMSLPARLQPIST
jgi:hypothetical protein